MPTKVNDDRVAIEIEGATLIVGPTIDSEHSWLNELDWLRQWVPGAADNRYYIVVGDLTCPSEIWEGLENHVGAWFVCCYVDRS